MKIREKLNKIKNRLYLMGFLAWLAFPATIILSTINKNFSIYILIPFCIFGFCCMALIFGIRCPKCRGVLGYVICWPPGKWFKISEKIKYCPFCGLDFDSEI
ncbi:MAG: hypothetical protein ABIG64_01285 [Candidatus Omnitrophota bacterium]